MRKWDAMKSKAKKLWGWDLTQTCLGSKTWALRVTKLYCAASLKKIEQGFWKGWIASSLFQSWHCLIKYLTVPWMYLLPHIPYVLACAFPFVWRTSVQFHLDEFWCFSWLSSKVLSLRQPSKNISSSGFPHPLENWVFGSAQCPIFVCLHIRG